MEIKIVELKPIPVMYLIAFGDPPRVGPKLFMELEKRVGLKRRKFYGVYNSQTHEYRACVKIESGDDPLPLALISGITEGGLYASIKLRGDYHQIVTQIGPGFDSLAEDETKQTLTIADHNELRPFAQ